MSGSMYRERSRSRDSPLPGKGEKGKGQDKGKAQDKGKGKAQDKGTAPESSGSYVGMDWGTAVVAARPHWTSVSWENWPACRYPRSV